MQYNKSLGLRGLVFLFASLLMVNASIGQKNQKVINDARTAKAGFIKADPGMASRFSSAYGYAIFPNIGKGAIGIGGAAGNGAVWEHGKLIGMASMKQVTIGFQFGGQAYREVIFFEDQASMDRFKQNNVEISAQVSAVAATAGASANASYKNGVLIFTQTKGGLMYEASVGGQKFKFTSL